MYTFVIPRTVEEKDTFIEVCFGIYIKRCKDCLEIKTNKWQNLFLLTDYGQKIIIGYRSMDGIYLQIDDINQLNCRQIYVNACVIQYFNIDFIPIFIKVVSMQYIFMVTDKKQIIIYETHRSDVWHKPLDKKEFRKIKNLQTYINTCLNDKNNFRRVLDITFKHCYHPFFNINNRDALSIVTHYL